MQKPILIELCGLPRSGKSTISKTLSAKTGFVVVNRDSIRLALHGQRFDASRESEVNKITRVMVKALFLAGANGVILDETNMTRKNRKSWNSEQWDVYYLHVDTPIAVCKERAIATNQPDLIPVIDRMSQQFQSFDVDEKPFAETILWKLTCGS